MHIEYLMGNEAIGMGAVAAGVNVVAGYPGTPSTEVLETIAKHNPEGNIHVEWSTNEKAGILGRQGAGHDEAGRTQRGVGPLDEPGVSRRQGRHGRARGR